jgi:hypothetical protein
MRHPANMQPTRFSLADIRPNCHAKQHFARRAEPNSTTNQEIQAQLHTD